MYKQRAIEGLLQEAARHFPAVAVVGARQVGKSTLLRHFFPKADLVVFDPVQDIENARRDPDLFLSNHKNPLILDEVQYAPEVLSSVKRAIDRNRQPGMFLITGSQQWMVMSQLSDSLSGRICILHLEGFSMAERCGAPESAWLSTWLKHTEEVPRKRLAHHLHPAERIWRGALPESEALPERLVPGFFDDYLKTYIERDARQMGNVADWQLFSRFTRMVFALSGQEINRSQLGRELGLHNQTAQAWLALLSATFQWHETPPWHGNALKRLSKKPKGYAADTGLMCSALAIGTPSSVSAHPAWGFLFETSVVAELRAQLEAFVPGGRLHHWRSHGGAEVDVVIEWNGRLHPIEIKGASHPGAQDASGIQAFRETYPEQVSDTGLILAPADSAYEVKPGIWVVPWDAAYES